ncbi:hypothetical protein [Legionella nagasakiensis]|uniref:hypothetical protein n=1 Tax=Legionella nagasakiensis TaxID=535290 RepID=UPI001055BDD8|nr:hypothetical protein [Legionella nagasakiensis]
MVKNLKTKQQPKRAPPKKTELNTLSLIIIDGVSILFSLMPSVFAFNLTGLFLYYGYSKTWLVLLLAPFVLFATFIAIVAVIRLCLPTIRPGRYKRELNRAIMTWYCHFALARAAKICGLIFLLQSFNITKFFYWRALGAKVSFRITNSFDIDFVDCPLISIGKGVTLGSGTNISCHSDIGNYLYLAPVVIEDDVFIAMANTIGPGTTIKSGAWIGYGNALINQVIEENTRMDNIRPTKSSS